MGRCHKQGDYRFEHASACFLQDARPMRAIYHRSLAIPLVLLVSAVASAADVAWLSDFSQARQLAVQSGKPILIHFYSTHCPPCKLLDAKAFKTPELIQAFEEHLIAVKINVDEHRELADQYQITRWPTDVYLFPNGSELHRMVSPQDPAVYRQVVERVGLRNRDWVAEQNALYAAQQKRIQSAQHATNLRTPAERTPVQETAPGQVPKPVIGRLTSYPLRNDATKRLMTSLPLVVLRQPNGSVPSCECFGLAKSTRTTTYRCGQPLPQPSHSLSSR